MDLLLKIVSDEWCQKMDQEPRENPLPSHVGKRSTTHD